MAQGPHHGGENGDLQLSIGPSDDRPYGKILRFLERAAETLQRIEVKLSTVEGALLRALTWRGVLDVTDIVREIERHLTGSDVPVVANIVAHSVNVPRLTLTR